jgi:hypothetical protein
MTTHGLEVLLEDGREVKGEITYVRPGGQRRPVDFLNSADLFFAVRDGDRVHLVNRSRVVSVITD